MRGGCRTVSTSAPKRVGSAPYSRSIGPSDGAVDKSTDEASSSSTSLRERSTRGERVRTRMPGSTAREQAGARTRAPSTSTTQTRHALTGVSVFS
jgi:hypothetical protein